MIPDQIKSFFEYTHWIWYFTQYESYAEMSGMAEVIKDERMKTPQILLVNVLYELESWCTSIVAK